MLFDLVDIVYIILIVSVAAVKKLVLEKILVALLEIRISV